jgi:PKD repeat protein
MYRTIIILFLAFVGIQLQAQYSITKQAYVLDSLNNPVPNYQVVVESEHSGYSSIDTLLTDNSGKYVFSKTNIPYPHVFFKFSILDSCYGVVNRFANDTSVLDDFTLCITQNIPCNVQLFCSPDTIDPSVFHFSSSISGFYMPNFKWERNYLLKSNLNHYTDTFANPSNNIVVLTVSDSVGGCWDSTMLFKQYYNPSPCSANFTHTIDATDPMTIHFHNHSMAPSGSYHWNFGDGQTDSSYSTMHTYAVDGVYPVSLVVNGLNCSDTLVSTINVSSCISSFAYEIDTLNPLKVKFNNQSSGAGLAYQWSFGDGNNSVNENPTHIFGISGNYQVELVSSNGNCSDTSTVGLNISNCTASFSSEMDSLNPLSYQFTNTSTGSFVNTNWDFGDGNNSSLHNPVHTYLNSNYYNVKLTLSGLGCLDSVSLNLPVSDTLQADYTYSIDPSNPTKVQFVNTSRGINTWNVWFMGDGNMIYGTDSFQYTYNTLANYHVKLRVYGLSGQDSITKIVSNLYSPSCNADFSYSSDTANPNMYQFVNQSTGTYHKVKWKVNGQLLSTQTNFTYTFQNPSVNNVCLIVEDTLVSCSDTLCSQITLTSYGNIYGYAYAGSTKLDFGTTFLYSYDGATNSLIPFDTVRLDSITPGLYYFDSIPIGTYKIKVEIDSVSSFAASYYSGWSANSPLWQNADTITVLANANVNAQIYLPTQQVQLPLGTGLISGVISEQQNSKAVFEGVSVYLMTTDSFIIERALSDQTGSYTFENLPYGNYMLFVDIPGLTCQPWLLTLTPNQNEYIDINWVVDGEEIVTHVKFPDSRNTDIQVFPIPTSGELSVRFLEYLYGPVDVQVFAMTGQLMIHENYQAVQELIRLDCESLEAGCYFLSIQLSNGLVIKKLFTKI